MNLIPFSIPLQLLISGGVDSTVCALLLKVALPAEQIITVHIDNGEFTQRKEGNINSSGIDQVEHLQTL